MLEPKLFLLEDAQERCWLNRLFEILIPTLWLLIFAGFLVKNSQNRAKSNHIFPGKGRGNGALIFKYLDSPMAKVFCKCKCIYFFSISAIFREKRGVKVGPKVQTLGTFRFHKNLPFSKILKLKITFSLVECYLWWKFYQSRTMFTEFRAEIAPPERAMLMLNQYEKNWKFITWQPQTLYLWNVLRLCIFIRPSIWQIIEAWFITCNRA